MSCLLWLQKVSSISNRWSEGNCENPGPVRDASFCSRIHVCPWTMKVNLEVISMGIQFSQKRFCWYAFPWMILHRRYLMPLCSFSACQAPGKKKLTSPHLTSTHEHAATNVTYQANTTDWPMPGKSSTKVKQNKLATICGGLNLRKSWADLMHSDEMS